MTEYVKEKPSAIARADALIEEGAILRVPAASWVEVLHAYAPKARERVAAVMERSTIFAEFTRELADHAARLQHDLRREGAPLGWHDLQIATTALHYGEPLVSNDAAFDDVPGLVRLDH